MPAYTLRPAAQTDADAIRALILASQINPTGLDWQRFTLAQTQDGQLIGCGQLKPHRDGSLELASIAVIPEWRGKGIARALIEQLITGHTGPLYLMCQSSLGPMYKKFGFRTITVEEMPKYFRRVSKVAAFVEPLVMRGETLLVMHRG
ncbi:MAG: GNAT family N-acetyltransferase [Anaerolineae bacterium]|nr:GNAT family N-acetyltransferase [Anaerolineae bacterium]